MGVCRLALMAWAGLFFFGCTTKATKQEALVQTSRIFEIMLPVKVQSEQRNAVLKEVILDLAANEGRADSAAVGRLLIVDAELAQTLPQALVTLTEISDLSSETDLKKAAISFVKFSQGFEAELRPLIDALRDGVLSEEEEGRVTKVTGGMSAGLREANGKFSSAQIRFFEEFEFSEDELQVFADKYLLMSK